MYTDDEVETCAAEIAERAGPFHRAVGMSEEGKRLADALARWSNDHAEICLLVNDVLESDETMLSARQALEQTGRGPVVGVVVKSESPAPDWVLVLHGTPSPTVR